MNTQLTSVRARNLNPGLSDFKGHALTHYFASASGCPHGFSHSLGQPPWSLRVHSRSESISSGPDRHTSPTSTSWVLPRGQEKLGQRLPLIHRRAAPRGQKTGALPAPSKHPTHFKCMSPKLSMQVSIICGQVIWSIKVSVYFSAFSYYSKSWSMSNAYSSTWPVRNTQ